MYKIIPPTVKVILPSDYKYERNYDYKKAQIYYKKQNSRRTGTILKRVVVVFGLFFIAYQLVKAGQQTKVTKLIEKIKSKSCIDEKLAKTDSELLEWIATIQEYIELAEELDEIEKIHISLEEIQNKKMPTLEEALERIKQYSENKDEELLKYQLNIDAILINNYLNNPETINRIANYSKLAVICETADTCMQNPEEAATFADTIFLPDELNNYQKGDLIAITTDDGYGILLNKEYSELIWRSMEIQNAAVQTNPLAEENYQYNRYLFDELESLISDTNYVLTQDNSSSQALPHPVRMIIR